MADGDAQLGYLGVARSLSGRMWRERLADADLTRRHQLSLGLSEPLARALSARGVAHEHGPDYLNPTLKALFPDPSSFMDMDRAAAVLVDALERKRPLVVFADYDVDGASSAAQLVRWFRALGYELPIYVPDRITEGYGPSPAAFRRLKAEGAELVITVDCGAAAHDALACAAEIGLEVVVIDHHLMRGDEIPKIAALVNPNRPDCVSGQGHLAAAGVTFVLLAALNREARRRGLFAGTPEPDLRQWLDLAAMGAICDVTQLTGFNRALAAQGLKVMSAWRNPGLKALLDVAKSQGPASVFHVGFILGPRINAGGRIGRADLGTRLLSTDDPEEARALAEELDALNASRKEVEREVTEAAIANIERESNQGEAPMLLVAADGWHPGVIGIVAGRLRERYRKPVIVVGVDRAANVGKGSGRSQPGVNLGRAVQAAFEEGLLLAGGGHAMAAGLSVRPDTIPELRAFLCERLAGETEAAAAVDGLDIDALVTTGGCDRALWQDFQRLAPFGPGNPEPVFAAADVRVERPMALRGGHVRCTLVDGSGGKLKAVAWRVEDSEIGRRLMTEGGAVHVVGRLKPDDWQGRSGVEFEIDDVADPRRA
ncbi:single-stranded-DNA-specific exonuclease RecJ [Phenylobacterium hankyongense]|uniref:Single-stranded-DNA-specific exonuclease RecJ n=1 Tax=Phenylobacterium hankyongense TaxID=1813876 RepID=A0A328B5K0_9CAUL|nr:single-stranded-DNA-specific exonuclease RecJ [Phenylobacterium hankyongense]RAK61216.1 single-stranded-DNA-specific exonuclease RecJ [Phenylobacterium hankyongense]